MIVAYVSLMRNVSNSGRGRETETSPPVISEHQETSRTYDFNTAASYHIGVIDNKHSNSHIFSSS